MTGATIITTFELQVNDVTELSSVEELALANRVYKKICREQPWEFLKKQDAGSILTDATGSYITLPADFIAFTENFTYTNNSISVENNAAPKVIFTGTSYTPNQIINWSDRRQYLNSQGYAYVDIANSKIRFTAAPADATYEFDYYYTPDDLTTATSPVFPADFHNIIVFGMAVENDILQLSEKAKSYAAENQAKYSQYLLDLKYYNANLRYD
tara:strand:- start:5580 stop:6218 length:639 start_codon:yes stop_codon:yes gene_type:complete